MEQETLIVDGFVFPSFKEAQIALKEKKNIEIIKENTPLSDDDTCLELYSKLLERDMFKTEIGYQFLHELRQHLITECGYDEESLKNIVLPRKMEYDKVNRIGLLEARIERMTVVQNRLKIAIAALAFMVVAMFVIAAINPNAKYINAEHKVADKYSAWQEELEQREQAVKDKEAELNMNQ